MTDDEGRRLSSAAQDLLGDDWADAEPARIVAELALRYTDPAEVALHLDAARRAKDGRYSADETVDEIVRDVLARVDGSVGLQTFRASVKRVAGVRQPSTVKGYVRDAVEDGPFRQDPSSIGRWLIDQDAVEATATAPPR